MVPPGVHHGVSDAASAFHQSTAKQHRWCGLIGNILGSLLYGVSCAQTLYYFWHYPKDRRELKIFIAFLWALDTGRTITHTLCEWAFMVIYHANPVGIKSTPAVYMVDYFLTGLTIFVAQRPVFQPFVELH